MDWLFYYTGAVFWWIVILLTIYLVHSWLYSKSLIYSEIIEFICLPYIVWKAAKLSKKQQNFIIKASKTTRRPSVKIVAYILTKINKK